MISSRDLFLLQQGLLDLYASGLDLANFPARTFRLLNQLCSVELTVHGTRDDQAQGANVLLHFDRPLSGIEEVVPAFSLLAPKYPWFCANFETHDGRPHYRTDFYSDRQYRSLDIHSEVFSRWNHEHFMTMCVHVERGVVTFFGYSLEKDFTRRERDLVALAQPHLMAARRLAAAFSAAQPWSVTPGFFSRHGFTPRESEVIYWLTEGKSNIEISAILRIGLATVKGYLTSIFNKTGTSNRLAATLYAVELARKTRTHEIVEADWPLLFRTRFGPPLPK